MKLALAAFFTNGKTKIASNTNGVLRLTIKPDTYPWSSTDSRRPTISHEDIIAAAEAAGLVLKGTKKLSSRESRATRNSGARIATRKPSAAYDFVIDS